MGNYTCLYVVRSPSDSFYVVGICCNRLASTFISEIKYEIATIMIQQILKALYFVEIYV